MVFRPPAPAPPPGLLSFLLCSLGPIQMFPATTTLQKFTKRERERAASCWLGWKWRRGRVGAATSAGLAGEQPRSKNQAHQTPFKVHVNSTPCLGSRGHAEGPQDSQTASGPEGEALARLWLSRDQGTVVKTRPQAHTDLAPGQLYM